MAAAVAKRVLGLFIDCLLSFSSVRYCCFSNRAVSRKGKVSLATKPYPSIETLVNHSTYHRGQVAMMMRQLDAKSLPTDFHVFLLECPRAPR
jgi:hypothetical protein